jgi:hypothetical protein
VGGKRWMVFGQKMGLFAKFAGIPLIFSHVLLVGFFLKQAKWS